MDRERAAPGAEPRLSKGEDRGQNVRRDEHSSASAAARAGVPLQEIAKLVGRADLKSTQKYAKLAGRQSFAARPKSPVMCATCVRRKIEVTSS